MIDAVMTRGEATFLEDSLLVLDRNGYLEECYFVYTYSPIHDEVGKVGGVFVACNETTSKVVVARRLRTLRDLANRAVGAASDQQPCEHALQILSDNLADVPFAALYLRDGNDPQARLIATKGVPASAPGFAPVLSVEGGTDSTAPIAQVVRLVLPQRTHCRG
jgi:hypothetical protein